MARLLSRRGPLADSYPGAATLVVLALVPFLLLTAAVLPLQEEICKSTGLSTSAFDLALAMSDGAYAFGTVLAVQLAVHLPTRRMLLVYVTAFAVASVLAAWAPSGAVWVGAFVAQGLCTSLMLIAAVPPLVTGWPAGKTPVTGVVMNLCVFGAVAAGPSVGALGAATGSWHLVFWGVAGLALLALVAALATFEDDGPADRRAPWDVVALVLAAGGCFAAFFGAGVLEGQGSASAAALVPLGLGVALVVVLIVHQYRSKHPLMPVKQIATTFPVTGLVIALFSSAAAFGLMELLLSALQKTESPGRTALLFLPELAAAVVAAGLFGVLFRTRFTPVLALCGMAAVAVASALAVGAATGSGAPVVAASTGLVGLGVGASVSPALFLAGFSLRSSQLQRVFALIELLRGVSAFLIAPVLAFVATDVANPSTGTQATLWACCGLAVAGGVLALAVLRAGGARLQAPDLVRWQENDGTAWDSPPLRSGGQARRPAEPARGREPAGVGSRG